MMSDKKQEMIPPPDDGSIFDRVVSILEQARSNVVRAVNSNMVWAYWLIGREIVEELQGGEGRAEYGKQVLSALSAQLTERYGKGFSVPNLQNFRRFYLAYTGRAEILPEIQYPVGTKSEEGQIQYPAGAESVQGFSPQLSWSHYRVLMRVEKDQARDFYEREAIAGGWSKRTLERQVHTQYYERTLQAQQPDQMIAEGRQLQKMPQASDEVLKNPYVLEFLGFPDFAELHESDLERAIINHLQRFLLELGNGFAFVARQKHIRIDEEDRYVDLVFYHCRLKFYLLIDLKLGKLTHADVGQMDGYVRMYDGLFLAQDDNPTIGLILCTQKCDTVARYSVLNDRRQIFASKYLPHLPSEEQLKLEIERERRLIEASLEQREDKNEL